MADQDPEILSKAEAVRLWERATEAAKEAEVKKAAQASGRVEALVVQEASSAPAGYAVDHVRTAAMEAGISGEFIDSALADLRAERALPPVKSNALARRFLDNPPDSLMASRIISATPAGVLAAMEEILPAEPYLLTLIDQNGDPLDRGLMVFNVGGLGVAMPRGFAHTATDAGFTQLFMTLRPVDGTTPSCEMTVHAPISSHRLGFGVGVILSTVVGGVGAGAGVGVGALLGGVGLATGFIPVIAVAGALTAGGLGVKGFRALFRSSMRKATAALDALIGAVAVKAQGGWGIV